MTNISLIDHFFNINKIPAKNQKKQDEKIQNFSKPLTNKGNEKKPEIEKKVYCEFMIKIDFEFMFTLITQI